MLHRPISGRDIVDQEVQGTPFELFVDWAVVDPSTLSRCPPAPREWVVQDWLPIGAVTANYGDGGIGKTLLAQLLQTSCATGTPWLGLAVMQCPSIGLYCEDDEPELHRRQIQACDEFGLDMQQLSPMRWMSGYGMDNGLAEPEGGTMRKTSRMAILEQRIVEHGARLVVLDTAADLFLGNENDRGQVRQFIGLLNGIAHRHKCAVLLNAHPSRTGLQSGNIDGGSTAWSNSVRSRWSLARADGDDADPNERILTRRKANYASTGDTLRIRWQNGVLVPVHQPTGFAAMASKAEADGVFLALLDRFNGNGIRLSESKHGKNWAPKQMASAPDRKGLTMKDFEGAMSRLLAERKIVVRDFGRKGRPERALASPEAPQD